MRVSPPSESPVYAPGLILDIDIGLSDGVFDLPRRRGFNWWLAAMAIRSLTDFYRYRTLPGYGGLF